MVLYMHSSYEDVDSIQEEFDEFTSYDEVTLGFSIKTLFDAKKEILKVSGIDVTADLLTKSYERNKLAQIISHRCMPLCIRMAALHLVENSAPDM